MIAERVILRRSSAYGVLMRLSLHRHFYLRIIRSPMTVGM